MTENPSDKIDGGEVRTQDYWQELERADTTCLDLIRDCLDSLDEPEDMVGASVTGESAGTIFVLTATRKVRDGNMIMTLRYVAVDTQAVEASTGANAVRIRVQGSVLPSLAVLVKSVANGDATVADPMLLDARDDALDHDAALLTDSLADDPDETRKNLRDQQEGRNPDLFSDQTGGSRECKRCGEAVDPSSANGVNIGGAAGVDLWVHEMCPSDDGDDAEGSA